MMNILYCLYFALVDMIFYYIITNNKIGTNKYLKILILASCAVFTLLHIKFLHFNLLMETKYFFYLLNFSLGIPVLFFISKIQTFLFKRFYNRNQSQVPESFLGKLDTINHFIMNKLLFVMIYIYQFWAIWNENAR